MKINMRDILLIACIFFVMFIVEILIISINAWVTRIIPAVGDSLVPMVVILMFLVSVLLWAVFFKKD